MRALILFLFMLVIVGFCVPVMSKETEVLGYWIVWCSRPPAQVCKPHTQTDAPPWIFDSKTACEVDLTKVSKELPSGYTFGCVKRK